MIEPWIAWILLFTGIITQDSGYFIASGVFACANYLGIIAGDG